MWPFGKTTDSADIRALNQRIEELEDRQLRLEDQYRRLRGYVYVKKGLVGPADAPPPGEVGGAATPAPPRPMSRDELRRSLVASGRFIPGQPPKHE